MCSELPRPASTWTAAPRRTSFPATAGVSTARVSQSGSLHAVITIWLQMITHVKACAYGHMSPRWVSEATDRACETRCQSVHLASGQVAFGREGWRREPGCPDHRPGGLDAQVEPTGREGRDSGCDLWCEGLVGVTEVRH